MSQFNQMFNDTVVYLKFIKTEILVSHENEIYAIWKVQNLMVGRYYEDFFKGSSKKKKIKNVWNEKIVKFINNFF